jgi:hypothetical protein
MIEGGSFVAKELTLEPLTASSCDAHTVTATLHSVTGAEVSGQEITFTVLSGPNEGQSGTILTDENGIASYGYPHAGGAGMDTIQATAFGGEVSSNLAYVTWLESCNNVPEFPTIAVPVAMLLGLAFIVFWLGSRKNP